MTKGYIRSANCRRELTEATERGKPLVILRETDENHGTTTLQAAQEELQTLILAQTLSIAEVRTASPVAHKHIPTTRGRRRLQCRPHTPHVCAVAGAKERAVSALLEGNVEVVDYHREKQLKYAALTRIAELIIAQQLTGQRLARPPSLRIKDQVRLQSRPGHVRSVYVSHLYQSIPALGSQRLSGRAPLNQSVFDMIKCYLERHGVRMQVQPDANTPTLLLLWPGVFRSAPLVAQLRRLLVLRKAQSKDARRLSLARMPSFGALRTARAPPAVEVAPLYGTQLPFREYMAACPPELKELGLFDIMFDKFPETDALRSVATQLLAQKLPLVPINAINATVPTEQGPQELPRPAPPQPLQTLASQQKLRGSCGELARGQFSLAESRRMRKMSLTAGDEQYPEALGTKDHPGRYTTRCSTTTTASPSRLVARV